MLYPTAHQAFTIKGLLGLLGPWPLLVFTLKTQAVEIVEAKEQASKEIFPAYDWEVSKLVAMHPHAFIMRLDRLS